MRRLCDRPVHPPVSVSSALSHGLFIRYSSMLFVALCIDCNAKKTVFVSCFRMHEFATSRPAFRAAQKRSALLLRTQCAKCREFQGWNTMYEWLLLNYYKKTRQTSWEINRKGFCCFRLYNINVWIAYLKWARSPLETSFSLASTSRVCSDWW